MNTLDCHQFCIFYCLTQVSRKNQRKNCEMEITSLNEWKLNHNIYVHHYNREHAILVMDSFNEVIMRVELKDLQDILQQLKKAINLQPSDKELQHEQCEKFEVIREIFLDLDSGASFATEYLDIHDKDQNVTLRIDCDGAKNLISIEDVLYEKMR